MIVFLFESYPRQYENVVTFVWILYNIFESFVKSTFYNKFFMSFFNETKLLNKVKLWNNIKTLLLFFRFFLGNIFEICFFLKNKKCYSINELYKKLLFEVLFGSIRPRLCSWELSLVSFRWIILWDLKLFYLQKHHKPFYDLPVVLWCLSRKSTVKGFTTVLNIYPEERQREKKETRY